jgi:cell division protein FtsL
MEKAMKQNLVQAYKQAPWRKQLQYAGFFMAVLLAVAAVAGLYLSISGRTATTGRQVQVLDSRVESVKLTINDMQTELAQISSAKSMYARLKELGMQLMNPAEGLYVQVPGYQGLSATTPSAVKKVMTSQYPEILPEYTSTLVEWFQEKVNAQLTMGQVRP